MANYFQDPSQSFVPTPVYRPPFEALQNILTTKQSKYDTGLESIRAARNSIFNAPITGIETSAVRDQHLKEAEKKLQNLSQVDLSQESNQRAAMGVFSNFYKDQDIINDMVWTKENTNEINTGLSMRDSKDEKQREGYFEDSIIDLQNAKERVRNGKKGDGSVFDRRRYVVKRDLTAYANKAIKDAGFTVQTVTGKDGPQLRSVKNGVESFQPYKDFIAGVFGNQFDDMFGVYGRVENDKRYKQAIAAGATEENAKKMVAQNFIDQSTSALTSSLETIDAKNKILLAKLETYKSPDGGWDPLKINWVHGVFAQQAQMKAQRESNEKNLNSLKNDQSKSYLDIFNGIKDRGDDFFGNSYRDRTITNLAAGYASGIEETFTENKAYQNKIENDNSDRNYQLEVLKEQNKVTDNAIKNGIAAMKKSGKTTTTTDADGNVVSTTEDGNNGELVQGHDIGYTSVDPKQDIRSFDKFKENLHQEFLGGTNKKIDAITALIPSIGIGITGEEAANWGESTRLNFADLENHGNTISNGVKDKLVKYVQDNGGKITPNCPSCLLAQIYELSIKPLMENASLGKSVTPDQLELITSGYQDGEKIIQGYNAKNEMLSKQVNSQLATKLAGEDKLFYENITTLNPNTKQRELKQEKDIAKELGSIFESKDNSNSGTIGTFFSVTAGIAKHLLNSTKEKINSNEFVKEYLAGNVSIDSQFGFNGMKISVKGKDNIYVDDEQSLHNLLNFQKKYGNSEQFSTKMNGLKTKAAESILAMDKNGFIGRSIEFPVHAGSEKNDFKPSEGYDLLTELTNPANAPEIEGVDRKESNLNSLLVASGGKNTDWVSMITWNTLGSATLKYDLSKIPKDILENLKLTDSEKKQISTVGMTVTVDPNAAGEIIKKLPKPDKYQVYGDIVSKGKTFSSTPLQDAYGFKFAIYPNTGSVKGGNANTVIIETDIKVWMKDEKDQKYKWMYDPENPENKGRHSVPLYGPNGRLSDDIVAWVDQRWKSHANIQNNKMKQNEVVTNKTPDAPGLNRFETQAEWEVKQQ